MSDFDLSGLFQQAQQMHDQMMSAQEEAAAAPCVGVAGGGLVEIELTGGFEARAVRISSEAIDPDDPELLSDLVLAALRDALGQAVEMQSAAGPDLGGLDLGNLDIGGLLGGLGLGGGAPGAPAPDDGADSPGGQS